VLRFFLKRRTAKLQRKKLLKLYSSFRYATRNIAIRQETLFNSMFNITLPKRQQFFSIVDLTKDKFIGFSAGRLLSVFGRKAKFFKRNPKNATAIALQLKSSYSSFLRFIYLFYIKNFNNRQFFFFKKFMGIVSPQILYLTHRQSFIPRFLPKRRIRRRVLKALNNQ
jgi:hypothetical protein